MMRSFYYRALNEYNESFHRYEYFSMLQYLGFPADVEERLRKMGYAIRNDVGTLSQSP